MRTTWMIAITILTIAFSTLPSAAKAQIAAPRLNPVSPKATNPVNPAAQSFNKSSWVSAALSVDFTTESTIGGTTTTTREAEGDYLIGAQISGEFLTLGAEADQLSFTRPNTDFTGEFLFKMVNLSIVLGESLAIGGGFHTREVNLSGTDTTTFPPFDIPFTLTEEGSLPLLGAVIKFGDNFFAGFAAGDETVKQTATFDLTQLALGIQSAEDEGERGILRYGIGYYSRDGENGLHAELYVEEIDLLDFSDPNFSDIDGEESTSLTLETIISNVLFSVEYTQTDLSNATGVYAESKSTDFSVGWVPEEGFSVVFSMGSVETVDSTTGDSENEESTFLGIAWLF